MRPINKVFIRTLAAVVPFGEASLCFALAAAGLMASVGHCEHSEAISKRDCFVVPTSSGLLAMTGLAPETRFETRVQASSRRSARRRRAEGIIVDRRTNKVLRTFTRLGRDEFAALNNVTIKGLRLSEMGKLNIGGRTQARFFKYPNHRVEIDIDQGVITKARIYDNRGRLRKDRDAPDGHRRFILIVDRENGKLLKSAWGEIEDTRFQKFNGVTIKGLHIDSNGGLQVGGRKRRFGFSKYTNRLVEIDVDEGCIIGIRIYNKRGRLIPDKETGESTRRFATIVDRPTEKLLRSFWVALGPREFRGLHNVTIKNTRLDKNGVLVMGRSNRVLFTKHPRRLIEIDVDYGVITEIRIYDKRGRLIPNKESPDGKRRFAIVIDRATGAYLHSFLDRTIPAKFKKLSGVTIKQFRLDKKGILYIGGKSHAVFTKYPNRLVELDVDQGVVTVVRIYDKRGRLIRTKQAPDGNYHFALIVDRKTGAFLDSFWQQLSAAWLSQLDGVTIKRIHFDRGGSLTIGGRWQWRTDARYGRYPLEIDVDRGVISAVRLYDKMHPDQLLKTAEFKIVFDSTGKVIDSFSYWLIPPRLGRLVGKITGFNVEPFNGLKLRGNEVYFFDRWGNFLGQPVDVIFENKSKPGQVTSFQIRDTIIAASEARSDILQFLSEAAQVSAAEARTPFLPSFATEGEDEATKRDAEEGRYRRVRGRVIPSPIVIAQKREFARLLREAIAGLPSQQRSLAQRIVELIPHTNDSEEETREEIIARQLGISAKEVFAVLRSLSEHPKLQDFRFEGIGKSPALTETLDEYVSRVIRGGA